MMMDIDSPDVLSAYDELPLWSAMFGLLLWSAGLRPAVVTA